jgi:hypothetical protein
MKPREYLKSALAEYGPGFRAALQEEVFAALARADTALRDQRKIRRSLRAFAGELFAAARSCPHGNEERTCEECGSLHR